MGFRIIKPLYRGSQYIYTKNYRGSINAIIIELNGTIIDKYSIGSSNIIKSTFLNHDISIENNDYMSFLGQRNDIKMNNILELPNVCSKWKMLHGRYPNENDKIKLSNEYHDELMNFFVNKPEVIPESVNIINMIQKLGIKVGVSTNYTQNMVQHLLQHNQSFKPDSFVTPEHVTHNIRPQPHMIYKNLDNMNIYPIQSVVKIDNTVFGLEEGLEAGCWSVGVSQWSPYMNIDNIDYIEKQDQKDIIETKIKNTRDILLKTGAHYVVDSLKELPEVIDDINRRISYGEKP